MGEGLGVAEASTGGAWVKAATTGAVELADATVRVAAAAVGVRADPGDGQNGHDAHDHGQTAAGRRRRRGGFCLDRPLRVLGPGHHRELVQAGQRGREIDRGGEALLRPHAQGALDSLRRPRRHARVELAHRDQLLLAHGALEAVGRHLLGEQVVQRGAERIDVGARVGAAQAVLLGWREAGRERLGADRGALGRVVHLGQAEVHQYGAPLGRDLNVAGLDVAVQDRLRAVMQVLQGIQDFAGPAHHLALRQRPIVLVQQGLGVFTGDEVHHQVLALVGDDEVIGDARQVGMAQAGQQRGFTLELTLRLGRDEQVLFDGDVDAQVFVVAAVHGAHAAMTQFAEDAIPVAQEKFRLEWHTRLWCGLRMGALRIVT